MSNEQRAYALVFPDNLCASTETNLDLLHEERTQSLKSLIPYIPEDESTLVPYFEIESLLQVHACPELSAHKTGKPLHILLQQAGKANRITELQACWMFSSLNQNSNNSKMYAFTTLADFDQRCLPLFRECELDGKISKFLRSCCCAASNMDTRHRQQLPSISIHCTYNLSRCNELLYNLWFVCSGNQTLPCQSIRQSERAFFQLTELVRVFADFGVSMTENWISTQIESNRSLIDFLVGTDSLRCHSDDGSLIIEFGMFMTTILPMIPGDFAENIVQSQRSEKSKTLTGIITPEERNALLLNFIQLIEEQEIVAYYHRDKATFTIHRVYDLSQLSNAVLVERKRPEFEWKKSSLHKNSFIYKIKERWMIELQHFLIHCIANDFFLNEQFRDQFMPIVNQLQSPEWRSLQLPMLDPKSSRSITTMDDSDPLKHFMFTEEEALGNIRRWDYASRYLEIKSAMSGYPRRIFGQYHNLYEARHLARIAGPYTRLDSANHAVNTILEELDIAQEGKLFLEKQKRWFVTVGKSEFSSLCQEINVSYVDFFQHHIWHRLATMIGWGLNKNIPEFTPCRLANAYREGAYNTDNRVRNGSAQVVEETIQNNIRLNQNPAMTGQQRMIQSQRLEELETEIQPSLANNEAQNVRSCISVAPIQPMPILAPPPMELELHKAKEQAETERYKIRIASEETIRLATIAVQADSAKSELKKQRRLALKETEMTARESERTKQTQAKEATKQAVLVEKTRLSIEQGKWEVERIRLSNALKMMEMQRGAQAKNEVVTISKKRQRENPAPEAAKKCIMKVTPKKILSAPITRAKSARRCY